MTPNQVEVMARLLGRSLSKDELTHYEKYYGEDRGYVVLDDRPEQNNRKNMLFYTACNGRMIRHYVKNHRPDIYSAYNLHQLYVHSLVILSTQDKVIDFPDIVPALFRNADVLFYNPIGAVYQQFSDQNVLRFLKLDAKALSYSGPNQGCWWVICPIFGEHGAWELFDQGLSNQQVWNKLQDGSFDPKFEERFKLQMAWMKGHDSGTDAGMFDFILNHYKRCKMFFTFNHPTYNLIACIADQCFTKLGYTPLGDEHSISLPSDSCMVADVYPESHYEFDYFKFEYPMKFDKGMGGFGWYKERITEARQRWVEDCNKKGIPCKRQFLW